MERKKCIFWGMIFWLFVAFVTVTPSGNAYAANKVSISNKTLKLKKGVSFQLKLKGTKKKPVWKSSNKKIATVSKNGKVKAKKAGKAVISAKIGKKKYKCKLRVYAGSFKHKHKYIERIKVESQSLILDPAILPIYSFSVGLISGYNYDPGDLPDTICFEYGRGYANGYFNFYEGIVREGEMIDDSHFKVKDSGWNRGDMSLVTSDTNVVDLEKLDWYCVHDRVTIRYKCIYCNKLKNNAVYSGGADTYVDYDATLDKNFMRFTRSKNNEQCTCREFVRKQYGCWWLLVKTEPGESDYGKTMKVTSKILRKDNMVSYEVNPIKIQFSRCKHENELVYCGSTYDYGPRDLNINDEEHNRYQCLDCNAILYKKDLEKNLWK